MKTLEMLILALCGVFGLGCFVRCIALGITMMFETGDKSGYKQQMKHTLLVLVIIIIAAGTGALPQLFAHYFS